MKPLRSGDRKAIMDANRKAESSITHGKHKLLLFADYSVATRRQFVNFQLEGSPQTKRPFIV